MSTVCNAFIGDEHNVGDGYSIIVVLRDTSNTLLVLIRLQNGRPGLLDRPGRTFSLIYKIKN